MTKPTFLDAEELRILTGRAVKAKQIEALRKMGVPFLVNALGRPVVARSAIEGRRDEKPVQVPEKAWEPAVLSRQTPPGRLKK